MKKLKKIIEQAIQDCHGSDLAMAKNFLSKALKEIKKIELKESSKKNNFINQWKFDLKTSSVQNLNHKEIQKILTNIDDMISSENKKFTKTDDGELIID
jgi:hypothetical protein